MEWALEDREGVSDLIEYEARFNLIHDPRDPVVCAYDLRKVSADVIMDVLRTHPSIIIGGILQDSMLCTAGGVSERISRKVFSIQKGGV